MQTSARVWMVVIGSLFVSVSGGAALLDPAFTETTLVASADLAAATGLAWAPDGSNRLFVIKKDGEIRIIKDGALLPTPFATVTPLYLVSECGLIGIAFDPNFPVTHAVYVFATVSATEQQIIRYTAEGDIGTAKTIVVPGLPTLGQNHDGGGIGFGPDGKLYWSIGDNGGFVGANDDLTSLAAKVSRANLDGSPVSDNPFFDGAGPNADHIWARGFRNPFTLNFQPATGLLWVDDVGTYYEQIFVVRRGDHAGWSTYENNQPTGFITPVIKYHTNDIDVRQLLPGATRTAGRVTFVTDVVHGFRLGEKLLLLDPVDSTFMGNVFVSAIPSDTSFTVLMAGPDAVSGGGSVHTNYLGGAVTGGAFYDATGFPAPYRGNFFFGDFNGGFIHRATIDPVTNNITSVDQWATGVAAAVDVAIGPDGALYYVGVSSNAVFRAAFNATQQGLVVSPTNVWIAEGQPAVVTVSLAMMPAADLAVTVVRSAGDADIRVASGAALTFTGANWNVPQAVTLAAGRDLDTADDAATISVSAAGLTTQDVTVHARDDNSVALVVSAATVTLDEGGSTTFTVALSQQPSLDVTVMVSRTAGDPDIGVAAGVAQTLTFSAANWFAPQTVTVSAAQDAEGTDDTATITVASPGLADRTVAVTARDNHVTPPDRAPTCSLNHPLAGETVSGTMADFSGDGTDDVGTVRAEFHIDGALAYSDVGTSGHYNYGGAPLRWDTTSLSNGSHLVALVIYDTASQTCTQQVTVVVSNMAPDGGDASSPGADAGTDSTNVDSDGNGDAADAGSRRSASSGCGCNAGRDTSGQQSVATSLGLALMLVMGLRRSRRGRRARSR